jgi:hypothetical protein
MSRRPAIPPRAALIIPMLGATLDAEVVAARNALVRALCGAGLDLNDLAAAIPTAVEPTQTARRRPTRLVITAGLVSNTSIVGRHGVVQHHFDPPALTFFLTYEDGEGGAAIVWEGPDRAAAIVSGRAWNLPLLDRTGAAA